MSEPAELTVSDVACTVCGCVCDDLSITVRSGNVTGISPGCGLAEPWWLRQSVAGTPAAFVDGRPVSVEEGIRRAAAILRTADSPLVYGLSSSSTPGQRSAVRLADRIGACIDTTASTCHAPSIMALQAVGESTCSLGEIRSRSDLVIHWGSNPVRSHPRHLERFVDARGAHVRNGRSDRHLVVVDVQRTPTAELADTFIQVAPGGDFELIWALRGLLRGLPPAGVKTQSADAGNRSLSQTSLPKSVGATDAGDSGSVGGVPQKSLTEFAERLRNCRYGAVFFGLGLTRHGVPHANVEALLRLVTDLNRQRRFVARRMRIPGDVAGADSVLCWQTGYPFSVSLGRSHPRYNPGEFTANDMLARGEIDAAALVGSDGIGQLSAAARSALGRIPTILLQAPHSDREFAATVEFPTAVYGVHRTGTAYRMDEVPVPLRRVLDSALPSDDEVLDAITEAVSRGSLHSGHADAKG